MNSKERTLIAISHKEPDKVPIDSWLAPEISSKLVKLFNLNLDEDPVALEVLLGNDLLYTPNLGIATSFYIPPKEKEDSDSFYTTSWGIRCKVVRHKYGAYAEMVEHPLSNIKDYENYKFPDPEEENYKVCKDIIEKHSNSHAVVGLLHCTIFEGSWYLRGMENFMVDLIKRKDFANELMDKLMEYHLAVSKKLVMMGIDIIFWGDDIGCEYGPLISPELWREFVKPRYAYMSQELKKINKDIKIAFHSDGYIEHALDDFIEIGFDIINPLQPKVNDVEMIKRKYGKKLTFWGNVDTRDVLSHGSSEDVINEVKNVIRILAPGGGLLLCTNHRAQATERALDNVITYYWALEKLRNYPIRL